MNKYSKIIELLGEQGRVFEEVEDITNRIISEQIEELPQLLALRGELLERALLIKEEIDKACTNQPGLEDMLRCACDMSSLSDEDAMVFEASIRVRATVNRICKKDAEVYSRIEREKSSILEYLETLNSSINSVAESYKRAVQTGFPENRLNGDNDLMV